MRTDEENRQYAKGYAAGQPRIFVREGFFYMIALPEDDDLNRHAELNPGTLRIEDIDGNVLWPEGSKQ